MLFKWGHFTEPLLRGDYPAEMKQHFGATLPAFTAAEKKLLKENRAEFIGVNCYTSRFISPGEADGMVRAEVCLWFCCGCPCAHTVPALLMLLGVLYNKHEVMKCVSGCLELVHTQRSVMPACCPQPLATPHTPASTLYTALGGVNHQRDRPCAGC